MAEEDSSEKTERASPHKLREARKKGMTAKGQDLNSFIVMAAGLLLMYAGGSVLVSRSFDLSRAILAQAADMEFEPFKIMTWAGQIFGEGISILAAYVIPLMLIAILGSLVQTGLVFSFFPLKPDIQRLNPVKGFKRIFSMRTVVEAIKSVLKVVAMGLVIYFTIAEYMPSYLGLTNRSPETYVRFFIDAAGVLILRLLFVVLAVAMIDLLFVRWEFQKNLRMSKKEVKDEHKRFDGDPQIRRRQKEIARELLEKSKSLRDVSGADVVITNPTHYAVAIQYDRDAMIAPKVLSRGTGPLALKIREIAGRHQIPVIESPPLARRLYKNGRVGNYIPQTEYFEVASVLRKVYAMRRARGLRPKTT